jgi:hypothetical protein
MLTVITDTATSWIIRKRTSPPTPACSLRCGYSAVPLAPRSTDPETAEPHPQPRRDGTALFWLVECVSLICQPIPKPAVNGGIR